MTAKAPTSVDPLGLVSQLIDTGNVDTVYRDVYLQRARILLAGGSRSRSSGVRAGGRPSSRRCRC